MGSVGLTGARLVRTDTVNRRLLYLPIRNVNRDFPDNSGLKLSTESE